MGDVRWTPEEFARLLSLPEGHPDRIAAEADPAFDAWRRMSEAFVRNDAGPLDEADLAGPRAELSARLERELGIAPAGAPARRRSVIPARGSWLDAFFGPRGGPAPRAALALAVLSVVALAGWWVMARPPGAPALRGAPPPEGVVLAPPVRTGPSLELHWAVVTGADAYRVVFYDATLAEVARVDSLVAPMLVLSSSALPAGLVAGARVEVEVVALSRGDPVGRSRLSPVTLP
jgi:hypothetical protein